MQTVDYRWSRRVCFSRSSTNCHSLLLISESWESLRVCLTQCLAHLRSQPKDANLVWWTLCDFIPKRPPSPFLAFQSHHRIASTVWARTLVQSCRKAFALRERGNRRAGVLFSVHSRRGFFFLLFDVSVRGRWWARHGEFSREFDEKLGFPSVCKQHCVRLFYALQDPRVPLICFWKKKKKIMIHLNNMLIHVFDYIVVKCHSCCSWRIHTVKHKGHWQYHLSLNICDTLVFIDTSLFAVLWFSIFECFR